MDLLQCVTGVSRLQEFLIAELLKNAQSSPERTHHRLNNLPLANEELLSLVKLRDIKCRLKVNSESSCGDEVRSVHQRTQNHLLLICFMLVQAFRVLEWSRREWLFNASLITSGI